MEKNRQRKEEMPIHNNDHPLLDDLSDDDEFNGKLKYIMMFYMFNIIKLFSLRGGLFVPI